MIAMKTPWIPVVIGAIAGGLGCSLVYRIPYGPEFFAGSYVLGSLGAALIGIGGAVLGGLGAVVSKERWRSAVRNLREDRDERWTLIVPAVFLLTLLLVSLATGSLSEWADGQVVKWYFVSGAFLVGLAVRCVYDLGVSRRA